MPDVPKTLRLASALAALLIACFPTEPCACAAPLSTLIVRGDVVRGSEPVGDAIVQAEGFLTASCASSRIVLTGTEHATRTDASGRYTLRLATSLSPASRCLRLIVRPTSLGGSDSVVVAGVRGAFVAQRPPDTLTLNFAIP